MKDLGCAAFLSLLGKEEEGELFRVYNLPLFLLFAFIVQIIINLIYVKSAFALFLGETVACKTCISSR